MNFYLILKIEKNMKNKKITRKSELEFTEDLEEQKELSSSSIYGTWFNQFKW